MQNGNHVTGIGHLSLDPKKLIAVFWRQPQEVGNAKKPCRSSACCCGLRVRLRLWFWMECLVSRACSASAAICSVGSGLRWRACSRPPKHSVVGSGGSGSVYLAELQLRWQQRVSWAALSIIWYSFISPSRSKGMPSEALGTRCKHFHHEPSQRKSCRSEEGEETPWKDAEGISCDPGWLTRGDTETEPGSEMGTLVLWWACALCWRVTSLWSELLLQEQLFWAPDSCRSSSGTSQLSISLLYHHALAKQLQAWRPSNPVLCLRGPSVSDAASAYYGADCQNNSK